MMLTGFTDLHFITDGSNGAMCQSFLRFIIPLLHGSILSEKIQSFQFLDDEVAPGHQLLDLLRVCHVFILEESCLQALSEIS